MPGCPSPFVASSTSSLPSWVGSRRSGGARPPSSSWGARTPPTLASAVAGSIRSHRSCQAADPQPSFSSLKRGPEHESPIPRQHGRSPWQETVGNQAACWKTSRRSGFPWSTRSRERVRVMYPWGSHDGRRLSGFSPRAFFRWWSSSTRASRPKGCRKIASR